MSNKIKRHAPMVAMLSTVVLFSTACTLNDVLTIAKIIGIFA